ncbi:MAG: TFIIB-type zinc finger domain-containing protein [Ruminococcus sp.]|nr:TFIIB-type zinc finger domain-containing protein [Ruminococcus sp.]MBR2282984.1 TFIIB-type zinc finger domain-containing protein [Ruminococcus sp.]
MTELIKMACADCGGSLSESDGGRFVCDYCGREYLSPEMLTKDKKYISEAVKDIEYCMAHNDLHTALDALWKLHGRYPRNAQVRELWERYYDRVGKTAVINSIKSIVYSEEWDREEISPDFVLEAFNYYDKSKELGYMSEELKDKLCLLYDGIAFDNSCYIRDDEEFLSRKKMSRYAYIVELLMTESEIAYLKKGGKGDKDKKKQLQSEREKTDSEIRKYGAVILADAAFAVYFLSNFEAFSTAARVIMFTIIITALICSVIPLSGLPLNDDDYEEKAQSLDELINENEDKIKKLRDSIKALSEKANAEYPEIFSVEE